MGSDRAVAARRSRTRGSVGRSAGPGQRRAVLRQQRRGLRADRSPTVALIARAPAWSGCASRLPGWRPRRPRVRHLRVRAASDLAHALDDQLHAGHPGLRQEPAAGVDRQLAAELDRAVLDELAAVARGRIRSPRASRGRDREAVIELGHVDVGRGDPSHRERRARRDRGGRLVRSGTKRDLLGGLALTEAENRHRAGTPSSRARRRSSRPRRRRRQRSGSSRRGAVARRRSGEPGDRRASSGPQVTRAGCSPLVAAGDRDRPQLLAGRAVLRHVALGHHRVAGGVAEPAVDRVVTPGRARTPDAYRYADCRRS